jgi:hypothetical protein
MAIMVFEKHFGYHTCARSALAHIGIVELEGDAVSIHRALPRLGVVGHRVKQHSVHIEKRCFYIERFVLIFR